MQYNHNTVNTETNCDFDAAYLGDWNVCMNDLDMCQHLVIEDLQQIGSDKVSEKLVSCKHGKTSRLPILESNVDRSNRVLSLAHSNDCMQPESPLSGSKYFVSFWRHFEVRL